MLFAIASNHSVTGDRTATDSASDRFLQRDLGVSSRNLMALDYKAFALEWNLFNAELRPILERALAIGLSEELTYFVEDNLDRCTDPYAGEPLSPIWQEIQEIESPC